MYLFQRLSYSYQPESKLHKVLQTNCQFWHRCGTSADQTSKILAQLENITSLLLFTIIKYHDKPVWTWTPVILLYFISVITTFWKINIISSKWVFCHQIIKVVCDEQTDTLLTKRDKYIVVHYHPCAWKRLYAAGAFMKHDTERREKIYYTQTTVDKTWPILNKN